MAHPHQYLWDRRNVLKTGLVGATLLGIGPRLTVANAHAVSTAVPAQEELIIDNARILTQDSKLGDVQGSVHVRGGVIVAVAAQMQAGSVRRMDARGGVLIPGLVDTHWHLWNSLARSFAPTATGQGFAAAMSRLSPHLTPELAYIGVRLGLAEALASGITTVHNWAHNLRSPAQTDSEYLALRESGLRGRFSYGYPQDLPRDQVMNFAEALRLQALLAEHTNGHFQAGIAVRGPERTVENVWQAEWAFAREHGLPLTTHIGVTRKLQTEIRAIERLANAGLLGPDIQLVHATHASEADCAAIARAGSPVSLSPFTEMRIGYGLPPVLRLKEAGVQLSLSIDNLVLGGNADPFAVMRTTLNLATGMAENEQALTARDVLFWATLGGARDLGLDEQIGSITPGKRADLVLLDTRRLSTMPAPDPAALVVQSAQPGDIRMVMADGRIRVEDGILHGLDMPALAESAERGWHDWIARAGI